MKGTKEKIEAVLSIMWLCAFFAIASSGSKWLLGLWVAISWLLGCLLSARESGWTQIAHTYPAQCSYRGQWKYFQNAQFNQQTSYGFLVVGANSSGIRLSMFLPLRLAHPPIFIPWDDLSGEKTYRSTGYLFFGLAMPAWVSQTCPVVRLCFAKLPSISVEIRRELGDFLEKASDGKWRCG